MARAIGGWLSGPPVPAGSQPGVRLGLPADGPGSVAPTGTRVGAFVLDGIVANLLVGLPYVVGARLSSGARGMAIFGIFLLVELGFDAVYGQTVGKRLFGIRVIRVDGNGLQSLGWLLLRTVLLGVLIPPVVWDRDRRGLHDRASGTVVVIDPNKAATTQPARGTVTQQQKRPSTAAKTSRPSKSARPGAPARRKRRR